MKNFLNNWVVRNLLLAVLFVAALAFTANSVLSHYTRHTQTLAVPDFSGMEVEQAARLAGKSGLRVVVSDSVNVRSASAGTVVKQEPKAGDRVKEGRRIRLTINAKTPRMIPMPNLVGFSLRSASAELYARGLNLGRLVYVEDIATNNVVGQEYRGMPVPAGTLVPWEAGITLRLGLGEDDNQTVIPDLTGLDLKTAVRRLHDSSLNVERLIFESPMKTYADSLACTVSRQFPEHSEMTALMGTQVTLWLGKSK